MNEKQMEKMLESARESLSLAYDCLNPRKKTVLVGQAPSRTSDPRRPLSGEPTASKLAALANVPKRVYLRSFERMNLLDEWPGKNGKGDAFPRKAAKRAANEKFRLLIGRRVVFLGKNVAEAFGTKEEFLAWFLVRRRSGFFIAAILPHPSGINIWWNDRANVRRAAKFFKKEVKT